MKPSKKIGITFGAFDLLHAGHCLMLKEAKEQCDYLVVGLDIDPSVTPPGYRGKQKNKPLQSVEERKIQLEATRYVDEVIPYLGEEGVMKLLQEVNPDIRIIGADWKDKKYTGWELPIEMYFNTRDHKFSSTELRQRILEEELRKRGEK